MEIFATVSDYKKVEFENKRPFLNLDIIKWNGDHRMMVLDRMTCIVFKYEPNRFIGFDIDDGRGGEKILRLRLARPIDSANITNIYIASFL